LLAFFAVPEVYSTPLTVTTAETQQQPKPGIIMIIIFENGTTKAVRSDSTNIQAVNGGYFISDSSVKEAQPLQSKTVSKTVVQQLVCVLVDVPVEDIVPPIDNCRDRTILDPVTGECEPVECDEGEILQGNTCVPANGGERGACAALYTYNPETGQCELPPNSIQSPAETEPQEPPVETEPEPEPEPEPEQPSDTGEGDLNSEQGNEDEEGGSGGDGNGGGDEEGGAGSDGGVEG
jgi:hypothetical protein